MSWCVFDGLISIFLLKKPWLNHTGEVEEEGELMEHFGCWAYIKAVEACIFADSKGRGRGVTLLLMSLIWEDKKNHFTGTQKFIFWMYCRYRLRCHSKHIIVGILPDLLAECQDLTLVAKKRKGELNSLSSLKYIFLASDLSDHGIEMSLEANTSFTLSRVRDIAFDVWLWAWCGSQSKVQRQSLGFSQAFLCISTLCDKDCWL